MITLFLVAVAVFGFGLVSERLAGGPLTPPIVFTLYGVVLGALGFDIIDIGLDDGSAEILVEATLVLLLFTDAARIDVTVLLRERWLPGRLLGIGLPGTIVLGAVVASLLFPDLPVAHAALIGAILAPTDAALGQAVVTDRRLPVRLRQGLNVESGLNDGIALPVVTVLLTIAVAEDGSARAGEVGRLIAEQIGFGLIAGIGVGLAGGWILRSATTRGWVEGLHQQLGTISVAALAFAGAELLGGNGFIAAFSAGLCFGAVVRHHWPTITDFTEDEGELLSAVTFLFFGAVLLPPAIDHVEAATIAYALLSLTVVRMIPVVVSLIGSRAQRETRLFIGWFGPRGLASILFALIVAEELVSEAGEQVYSVVCITVLASVILHGLTAGPWTGRLGDKLRSGPQNAPEMMPVDDMPWRR